MTYGSDMSFPYYPALDGSALEGVAYFGVAGQNPVTNPVTVFWDSAGTQPAAQPVTISKGRTVRSDGTPSRVWVASDYSVLVQDTLGRQVVFEPNQPVTIAASNAINQATAQAGLATAQTGLATAQAVAAAGSASVALGYSNTATSASATAGAYPNAAASNVPRGLTQASVGAITAGSGGTNGTFALAWSSGNFSVNPTGTFTVAGGVLTAVTITGPGLYIGSSPTVPTPSFAASSGLTGAAVVLTAQFLVTSGQGYWVTSADGLTLDRYKNVSGVATADASVSSIPTASRVNNVSADVIRNQIAVGDVSTYQTTETIGLSSPNTSTLGAGVYSFGTVLPDFKGLLKSVSICAAGAGSAEIHVYSQADATHWTVTKVINITFAGAGVQTWQTSDGTLPDGIAINAGGFVGVKTTTSLIRYVTNSASKFWTIVGDTGVGSTVTQTTTSSFDIGIAFTVENISSSVSSRVSAVEAFSNSIAWGKVIADALASFKTTETVGSTVPDTNTLNAGTFTGDETVASVSGVLTSVSGRVANAGTCEFHVYKPVDATHWQVTHVFPVTFSGAGVFTFQAGAGVVPNNIVVYQGGFVGIKPSGLLFRYGTDSTPDQRPPKFYNISGDTGVGSTVTIDTGTGFDLAYAYTLDTFDMGAVLQTKLNAAVSEVGANYHLSPIISGLTAYWSGDSISAAYNGQTSLASRVPTSRTVVDISTPGETIAQQKTRWQALTIVPANVGYVVIASLGANNIDGNPANTATIIAAYQDYVNTIRASIGTTPPIIIACMELCLARWVAVLGPTTGPLALQQQLDINTAIMGGGSTPITGVQGRVNAHVAKLSDSSGNLLTIYDTGDHIHPNAGGRDVYGAALKDGINAAAMVP